MHVCACVRVCVGWGGVRVGVWECECVCVFTEARRQSQVSSSLLSTSLVEISCSLANLCRPVRSWEVPVCLPSARAMGTCLHTYLLYVTTRCTNSGAHACVAGTLLSHLSSPELVYLLFSRLGRQTGSHCCINTQHRWEHPVHSLNSLVMTDWVELVLCDQLLDHRTGETNCHFIFCVKRWQIHRKWQGVQLLCKAVLMQNSTLRGALGSAR